jgi:hypothetical protein
MLSYRYFIALLLCGYFTISAAAPAVAPAVAPIPSEFIQLPLNRSNANLPLLVMRHDQAIGTVVLLPGGDAGTGKIVDGIPSSRNFLVRAREAFYAGQYNVVIAFRPSDLQNLDYSYRTSAAHIAEVAQAVDFAQHQFKVPVWLVGTSRGSVSATAATIVLGQAKLAGLVLTSSVTHGKPGAITSQAIDHISIPTMVVHHKNDLCKICSPTAASQITASLTAAPQKKFMLIEGGSDPSGDFCEALHWHGFINYEAQTVHLITEWMRKPNN